MHSGVADDEPVLERDDVVAIMGVMADINVHVARITRLLEAELGDD